MVFPNHDGEHCTHGVLVSRRLDVDARRQHALLAYATIDPFT